MSPNPEKDPPSSSRSAADESHEQASGTRLPCILLVEDNPADVSLISEALQEHTVRCEVTVLPDGERAMQHIDAIVAGEKACPQLIILDLNLPKRTGREVLERLRTCGYCSAVPVVVLSSSDRAKDREEVAQLGATKYIRKPSRLEEFLDLGGVFKNLLGM